MSEYKKPLPAITAESKPFWEGCRRHRLLIQRCRACGSAQHYPRGVCATCWSEDLEWQESSGRGQIYTFTVAHRAQARGFKDEVPYVIAYVELDEGVQVLTNLVGCDPSKLSIGMPVEVTFEDVNDEISIPRFKPASRLG
jgi:uncharacterized OB-fold protein